VAFGIPAFFEGTAGQSLTLCRKALDSSFSEIDAPIQTSFYMGIDGDT
jgi:hypothetical protein